MSNTPSCTSTSLRKQQALLRDQLFQAILSRDLHSVQRLWQEHNKLKAIRKRIEAEELELNDEPNDSRLDEDEEQEGIEFTEERSDRVSTGRRCSIEEREESEDLTALMVVMGVDSHWGKAPSCFRFFRSEWNTSLKIDLNGEGAQQTTKVTQAHSRTEFQLRCIDLLLSFGEGEEENGTSELSAKCKQRGWNVLHYAVMHRVDEEVLRSLLQRWRGSPEETCAIAPWVHEDLRVFSPDKHVPPVLLAIMERNMSAYHLLLSNVEPPPGSSSIKGWNGMDQLLFNVDKEREPLLYSICGHPFWYTPSFCNEALQALHERLPQQYFELWLNSWISNWVTDFPATPLIFLLSRHYSVCYGQTGVKHWEEGVKWLLQKGADPYLCAGNGKCSVALLWDYGSVISLNNIPLYTSKEFVTLQTGLYLAHVSSSLRVSVGEEEAKHVTPATIGILWLMVNKKGTQAITFTTNGILTKWSLCLPEQKQCKEESDTTSLCQPIILRSVDMLSLSAEMKKGKTKQKEIFNSDQNNGEELPLFCNTCGELLFNRRMYIRWHDLTVLPFPGKGYRVTSSDRRWVLLNDTVLLRFNSAMMRCTIQAYVPSSYYLDGAYLTLLDWKPILTDENDKNGTEKKKEEVTLTCVTSDAFARYVATFEVDEEEEEEEKQEKQEGEQEDEEEAEEQDEDDEKDTKKNLKWQEETIIPLLRSCRRSVDVMAINERRTKLVLGLVSRLECIDLRTGLQQWFLDTERNICIQRTKDGDYDDTQYPFFNTPKVTTMIIVALPSQSAEQQPYSMDQNATRKVEEPYEEEDEEECIVVGFCNGQVAMLSLNNPGHIFRVHKLPKVASFCARIHQPPSRTRPSVDCLVADKERGVVWAVGPGSPLIPLPLPTSASLPVGLGDVQAYEAVCFKRLHNKAKQKSPRRMPEEDSLLPYEDQNELHQPPASSISSVAALSTLCIDSLVRSLTPKSASLIRNLLPSDLKERCLRYLLFHTSKAHSPLWLPPLPASASDDYFLAPQRALYLGACHFSTFIPSCINLHSLDLTALNDKEGTFMSAIAYSLNEQNNLRHIDLSYAKCNVAALASLVARGGEKMESLELRSASLYQNPDAFRESRHMIKYKYEGLCFLSVLGTHCPNLRHLGLHGHSKLVNQRQSEQNFGNWIAFLKGCSGLEYLDLSFTDLTPQHLHYLSLLLQPSCLRVLILQSNQKLALCPGEEAVNQVLSYCTRLQTLNLLDCGSLRLQNLEFHHRKAVFGPPFGEKNDEEEEKEKDRLVILASAESFRGFDWNEESAKELASWR